MSKFTAMKPSEVLVGRARLAAEERKSYLNALRSAEAGKVELARAEKSARVKRLLSEASKGVRHPNPVLLGGQEPARSAVEEGRDLAGCVQRRQPSDRPLMARARDRAECARRTSAEVDAEELAHLVPPRRAALAAALEAHDVGDVEAALFSAPC